MKYPCLVIDHDDTLVNSTATVHFPAFQAFMSKKRPLIHMTLEKYFALNFEPGVIPLFRDICGLNEKEMQEEQDFWFEFVKDRIPAAFPGMREILWQHKNRGGLICVVSHSFEEYIRRDYAHNGLPDPDLVFGWDLAPELRKPAPWSLYEIEKRYDLQPSQLLMLDDLKPGYDMARAAGVAFAAAGWSNDVPEIEDFMRSRCDWYFKTVEEFGRWFLS